jgi:hypothetical protein
LTAALAAASACTGTDGDPAGAQALRANAHNHPEASRGPLPLRDPMVSRPLQVPANMPAMPTSAAPAWISQTLPAPNTPVQLDMRILVLAADGTEADLPAIRQILDYLGTPYDVHIAATTPGTLTADALSTDSHGHYQGVILATGALAYTDPSGAWTSALSAAEWQNLWAYEAAFGVREVSWYTYPTADYGYGAASETDTSATPYAATWTAAGRAIFPYTNGSNPVSIQYAWTYLAPPATGTTPLLTDAAGNALALVAVTPDGRETLSVTFDSAPWLTHTLELSYGLVNWVTRGFFLGEQHVYASPQVDDIFLDSDIFNGPNYRMTGADMTFIDQWQTRLHAQPVTARTSISMVFNGAGAWDPDTVPDTLTPVAIAVQSHFPWINHTYDHEELDPLTYQQVVDEIQNNNRVARRLGLTTYTRSTIVTPGITGLRSMAAMQAAYDTGIRVLPSDTSIAGEDNPTPNAGINNWMIPAILMVPRRPTNLFYNVSTPDQWVAEYNSLYHNYWGRDLTYGEIVDFESSVIVRYMLRGEMDPWMFHQANMRAYDGAHSLLTDLLEATLTRYQAVMNMPVVTPTFDALGARMRQRMAYNAAGVSAVYVAHQSVTITATNAATVPVTGLHRPNAETYAGQTISYVNLSAGQTATFPLP